MSILTYLVCLSPSSMAQLSPTSIQFWKIINDPLIQKIGHKSGNIKWRKTMTKYMFNPSVKLINKFALINAIGYDNKTTNSSIFYKELEKRYNQIKKEEKQIEDSLLGLSPDAFDEYDSTKLNDDFYDDSIDPMWKILGLDNFMMYQYLLAMENYDQSKITNIFNRVDHEYIEYDLMDVTYENIDLNYEEFAYHKLNEHTRYIYLLIKILSMEYNNESNESIWLTYNEYLSSDSIENSDLRHLAQITMDSMFNNSYNRDAFFILAPSLLNYNQYSAIKKPIWLITYPYFVYGYMKILDKNGKLIREENLDGDDFLTIELADFKDQDVSVHIKDSTSKASYILHINNLVN